MTTRTKAKTQKSEAIAKPVTQKYFDTKVFFLDGKLYMHLDCICDNATQ